MFEILNGIATIKTMALKPRSLLHRRRFADEAATLVLPLQGFVHALGVLEGVRARFVEQGLIGANSPPDGQPQPPPKPAKSLNFS